MESDSLQQAETYLIFVYVPSVYADICSYRGYRTLPQDWVEADKSFGIKVAWGNLRWRNYRLNLQVSIIILYLSKQESRFTGFLFVFGFRGIRGVCSYKWRIPTEFSIGILKFKHWRQFKLTFRHLCMCAKIKKAHSNRLCAEKHKPIATTQYLVIKTQYNR